MTPTEQVAGVRVKLDFLFVCSFDNFHYPCGATNLNLLNLTHSRSQQDSCSRTMKPPKFSVRVPVASPAPSNVSWPTAETGTEIGEPFGRVRVAKPSKENPYGPRMSALENSSATV